MLIPPTAGTTRKRPVAVYVQTGITIRAGLHLEKWLTGLLYENDDYTSGSLNVQQFWVFLGVGGVKNVVWA